MEQRENSNDQVERAFQTLRNFIVTLSGQAGKTQQYGEELWERIRRSEGVLKEVAYFHDYGEFYGKYKVAGYTLTDILVWQVDHFKAYMDRHEEMNRYRTQRLFLESVDILLKMEENPTIYVEKMKGETGTDFADKF